MSGLPAGVISSRSRRFWIRLLPLGRRKLPRIVTLPATNGFRIVGWFTL